MRPPTDVKSILERYPSRPWITDNLNHILQELMAADIAGDDSDSSLGGSTIEDSDLDILQNNRGSVMGSEPTLSRASKSVAVDSRQIARVRRNSKKEKQVAASSTGIGKDKSKSGVSSMQVMSLRVKDSEIIDLGKISNRLMRKQKLEPETENLSYQILPRVNEMVDAIKTGMKYNLQPENIKDEDDLERKIELNRLLKSYRCELSSFGIKETPRVQHKGSSIKGIPSFQYEPQYPKKRREKAQTCNCITCKVNRMWLDTKRKKSDDLAALLGEPRKMVTEKVWNCQCKGPRTGFNNKEQMITKIPVPPSMRPDELKKLNSVPRMEIYKHITPAENKVNIKDAVLYKPEPARPIIQQEMMCHTNEMRCVMLPPPFTGKVTKFETPDWVVEYNKRYVYDYFFLQSKNVPNVPFLHFSYKKDLSVLIEEIIQGIMTRTDIFDDDTCQCTFLCSCAHKTAKNPNATLLDAVRQAKRYCAADLHENNIYEAGDYMKSGDKTYFVCSKLCNARMKLHKQLHI